MKKYLPTAIFYLVSFAVIYVLNWLSPNQHDGGLGFGSLAVVIFVVTVFILAVVNIFKGFKKSSPYLLLAGIHVLVLLVLVSKLFL